MKNILYFLVVLAGAALFTVLGYRTLHCVKADTEKIPEFRLQQMNNQSFTNEDIPKGKNVLLVFFDPYCVHCNHEAEKMAENYQKFQNTEILFISWHGLSEIKDFAKKCHLDGKENITVLWDRSQSLFYIFEIKSFPYMILYDAEGQKKGFFKGEGKLDRILNVINN